MTHSSPCVHSPPPLPTARPLQWPCADPAAPRQPPRLGVDLAPQPGARPPRRTDGVWRRGLRRRLRSDQLAALLHLRSQAVRRAPSPRNPLPPPLLTLPTTLSRPPHIAHHSHVSLTLGPRRARTHMYMCCAADALPTWRRRCLRSSWASPTLGATPGAIWARRSSRRSAAS